MSPPLPSRNPQCWAVFSVWRQSECVKMHEWRDALQNVASPTYTCQSLLLLAPTMCRVQCAILWLEISCLCAIKVATSYSVYSATEQSNLDLVSQPLPLHLFILPITDLSQPGSSVSKVSFHSRWASWHVVLYTSAVLLVALCPSMLYHIRC